MRLKPDVEVEKEGAAPSAIHDFKAKLSQPSLLSRVKTYVLWQANLRKMMSEGQSVEELLRNPPALVPVSINLDLTTACNYACGHCVDLENLNTTSHFDHDRLRSSLARLAEGGLRSVIVIGGGEPTLYPRFQEIIRLLKSLRLQVGIVSNGTGNAKIQEIADCLEKRDWVRLSLDAGADGTFQAMHKPRRPITLEGICAGIPPIKAVNPQFSIGFSFIVVWGGAEGNNQKIVENMGEMVEAARLAKDHQFDYISFKPFLTRAPESDAEVIGLDDDAENLEAALAEMSSQLTKAKRLETGTFKVVESTNLNVLLGRHTQDYTHQPRTCHMTAFRQILSPLGVYNCPVYRSVPDAKLGERDAYADAEGLARTQASAAANVLDFDAAQRCKKVTCLYNSANWWIEDLIENPYKLDTIEPSEEEWDHFL